MQMFKQFDNLSDRNKGILLILLGSVLLLFIFGFMRHILHSVIILSGIFLVCLGLYKLQVHKKVITMIDEHDKHDKKGK